MTELTVVGWVLPGEEKDVGSNLYSLQPEGGIEAGSSISWGRALTVGYNEGGCSSSTFCTKGLSYLTLAAGSWL